MSRDELLTSFDFDESARSGGSHAVAASIAGYYAATAGIGGIVLLVAPDRSGVQVVAGGTESTLRAAISSAVSTGSFPAWQHAPDAGTAILDVSLLPETVRAATDGAGVTAIHVGGVRYEDRPASTALWFDTGAGVASDEARQQVLDLLNAAAVRDAAQAAIDAAAAADRAAEEAATAAAAPQIDPLDAIVDSDRFQDVLDDYEGDEAILLLLDVDEFAAIATDRDADDVQEIVDEVALRLTDNCRGSDVVARLDRHRFAVLLGHANKNAAMAIAKRIHGQVTEPIAAGGISTMLTVTVAFAHQDGLLDLDDLLETAERAVSNSRRAGPGRLVMAS